MKSLMLCISLLIVVCSNAQSIKKATSQGWAGGVCCVSGTNYSVIIEAETKGKEIELNTVWLKGYGELNNASLTISNDLHVSFGISSGYQGEIIQKEDVKDDHNIEGMPNFEGSALIVLFIDGKKNELIVPTFEELMYLAYP